MTAAGDNCRPGRSPWAGTRARTRAIGYGQAMYEMHQMLTEICDERPYLGPFLEPVRCYAWSAWELADPDGDYFDWILKQEGLRPAGGDTTRPVPGGQP